MPHTKYYKKLIRDRIPEHIEASGKAALIWRLPDEEYPQLLKMKLLEELQEFFEASDKADIINETADILEVLDAFLASRGISWQEVDSRREEKLAKNGGFLEKLFLYATGEAADIDEISATLGIQTIQSLPSIISFNTRPTLIDTIRRELREAQEVDFASAFYTRGMLNLLLDPFLEFTGRGGRLRILTSVMGNFNNPKDFRHLMEQVPGAELRIFYPHDGSGRPDYTVEPPPFHIKSILFSKGSGQNSLIVGSSNLTRSGLARNHEWNYFSNSEVNLKHRESTIYQRAKQEFEGYWHRDSIPVDDHFIEAYLPRWQKARELRYRTAEIMKTSFRSALSPRPAQREALQALQTARQSGISKTTVIAATGIGKTYLAAFDFVNTMRHPATGFRNVLFLVHRENILNQAIEAYREVLGDPRFGIVLTGNSKPEIRDNESVFGTVQTLHRDRYLAQFSPGYFDYIVIDEFHHAAANSYRRIIDHFRPRFMLGLTATPERMDGRDVLEICDYNICYEARMFDAIDREWLTPFQYFAIHDKTDYSSLRWTSRGYVVEELDQLLKEDTRAELIYRNLRKFLPSTGKIRALAFCSSRAHAEYMNLRFNQLGQQHGIRSECILGTDSIESREAVIAELQDENSPLQIICSVDVFSEGIDIPAVSHVLFLRPTQSFTVFLQQLGRGLRLAPEKDYLVALDFVGNFKHSYVSKLALCGFTSLEEYKTFRKECKRLPEAEIAADLERRLPPDCHVSIDTEVARVMEKELRRSLSPSNTRERLEAIYDEIRSGLDHSAQIMDFFGNPSHFDPSMLIGNGKLGLNWLRVKEHMDDLTPQEARLLDTPAEKLLQHIEKELNPNKSYKMVVLTELLKLGGFQWQITDIAEAFRGYYTRNRHHLIDWNELADFVEANNGDPSNFPLLKTVNHLIKMPLGKLVNTGGEFFWLDRDRNLFGITREYQSVWSDPEVRPLIRDRVQFALLRYFYRKSVLSSEEMSLFQQDSSVLPLRKKVGKSQHNDGVRIDQEYQGIFNPPDSPDYTPRGEYRKIKVLFNNKVFDARYVYENQSDLNRNLQRIQFSRELKAEFKTLFPEAQGEFLITPGQDLNHFVFEVTEMAGGFRKEGGNGSA